MADKSQSCDQKCSSCSSCSDHSCSEARAKEARFLAQMAKIKHKILVLSGKGGVGKSTVAVNLALSLALEGRRVGLLDVDIHGPSIPTMMGLKGAHAAFANDRIIPLEVANVKVISVDFFLENTDDALIWRGPMKQGAIQQFLEDVEWGELDYLLIDCPPGTGDEPLSVCQLIKGDTHAIVVTTPQEVAAADVRKSINFCEKLGLPIVGIIENMSGFVCPHCNKVTNIFKQGGGEKLAAKAKVPFLGRIPIDPLIAECSDAGSPMVHKHPDSAMAKAFADIIQPLLALPEE
ncbi:MAG: P-loop NTPase [Lentisphaeria bacterium]|jgi:ATP-binding protein involved in chromosome partitioning